MKYILFDEIIIRASGFVNGVSHRRARERNIYP